MSKDRRLGRGLAALLGEPDIIEYPSAGGDETGSDRPLAESGAEPPKTHADWGNGQMVLLNVYEIDDNPFQPRREFSESEIASLAESLKEHDMLQPIVVRPVGERYQLISGERRLRAAIHAGWAQVPARIREADDRLVAELAIVENLQRKDLNPLEKALSFQRYLQEHDCTQDDLARRIKLDRSTIANLVRLLELPAGVQEALGRGSITVGHARALLPLGDEPEQLRFCKRIQVERISVRDTERLVQEAISAADAEPLEVTAGEQPAARPPARSAQVTSLEQELRVGLGTKIEIRQSSRGRGRIVIHFSNHEEFDRLRSLLTDSTPTRSEAG